MGFLSNVFQIGKLTSFIRLLLLLGCSLSFSGCGGSSTSSPSVEVPSKESKQPSISRVVSLAGQEYQLVDLDGYETLGLQTYWPSDSEISTEVKTRLQSVLVQVNNRFSENNFAFCQSSTEEIASRYKKLFFSADTVNADENKSTQLRIDIVDDASLVVTYDIDSEINPTELSFKLTQAVYQSERSKYQRENSLFERLVSRGLALHFLQKNLPEHEFSIPVTVDLSALTSALAQLKEEKHDSSLANSWFSDKPISEQLMANAVGYYLVKQHFSFYIGSNASNSFSVGSELFLPWLDGPDNSIKKSQQYVRTGDVSDQIAVGELGRQANLFLGSYFIEGLTHEKLIALSFDDGPSQYTTQILDVLEQAQVVASFFWQGQSLAEYKTVVERSINAGHTVANHSWNHANGMGYSADELWQKQVLKTNDEFSRLFDLTPRFYRPPYGEISDSQIELLAEKGMKVLIWSVDSRDWNPALNSVEQIESELINNQHEEMITLMHDAGGNRQNTVAALTAIIEHYKGQGYRFVNLETLLGISDKH